MISGKTARSGSIRTGSRKPGRPLADLRSAAVAAACATTVFPFRLHWGKFQPASGPDDRGWIDFFADQYPRWNDFLALRAQRDPNNIFLTGYWCDRFGLWSEPAPRKAGD